MLRFDQRQKDEILAHEAGGRRNTREGKHEDQKQQCRGGAALGQTVQVFELFADQSLFPKHDDHRERARGHEKSEERRGGEEGRSRGAPDHLKKKKKKNEEGDHLSKERTEVYSKSSTTVHETREHHHCRSAANDMNMAQRRCTRWPVRLAVNVTV